MFGLFKKSKKTYEPLDHNGRKYFENNLLWLNQEFPEPPIDKRKVFTPIDEDFPIKWNHSENNAFDVLKIIAAQMQIEENELELVFFDNGIKEFNMGTSTVFLETDPETQEVAGMFHEKNENGKYNISIDQALLSRPEALIATIAHELSHVKLLGHKQLDFNDEQLTDMTTVFYGFGVFNANTSFQFYQSSDRWGYSNMGYLKQEEWAYILALFAFMRKEDNPYWGNYLNKTAKKDFENCLRFMLNNENEIFRFDESET